jgi:hypothetical protein
MTEQHVPWTHITGALAWAPMPAISNTENDRHNNNNNNNSTTNNTLVPSTSSPNTSLLLWPVILYPSWSTAARSPLFDCDGDILLMGCQKPVSKENLCSNRVPSRVALGKGANGSKFRLKVVAHYLGLSSASSISFLTGEQSLSSQPWGSVSVESLQQYTLENCETYIQIWERNGKDVQWNSLLNAMKEAAALMEQSVFDPMKLCKNLGIDPNYKNFSDSAMMDNNIPLDNDDDDQEMDPHEQKNVTKKNKSSVNFSSSTPENFQDWNHLSDSQTQTKFSQALTSL